MEISNKILGGNIEVDKIEGFDVYLHQEIRDTMEWWFYFSFKATARKEGIYTFHFTNREVISRFGPTVSLDGETYSYSKESFIDHSTFKYYFKKDQTIFFAFSYPYLPKNFEAFIGNIKEAHKEEIYPTEKGNQQYHYIIGSEKATKHMLITARHHACESTANYLLEGIVLELLKASSFLKEYQIHLIPFVDLDGVINGDQGKSRAPHDHNRDYTENPIYSSIKFIKEYFKDKTLSYYFDLHNPGKWGGIHNYASLIEGDFEMAKNQQEFSKLLMNCNESGIPYDIIHNIKYREQWNLDSPNSRSYFLSKNVKLGFTFEIPFCGELEHPYSITDLIEFGKSIAKATLKFEELHYENN